MPPKASRAQIPPARGLRAIHVVTTDDSEARQITWTRGPEVTGTMTLPVIPTLQGYSAAEIASDPHLAVSALAYSSSENTVAVFWNGLLGMLLSRDNLAVLAFECNLDKQNLEAGSDTSRAPRAYGPLAAESTNRSVGDTRITRHRDVPTASGLSSQSFTSQRSIEPVIRTNAALLAPLPIFAEALPVPYPYTPILVVEYKAAMDSNCGHGASAALARLVSAGRKASIHRDCIYGLLCVGSHFTRVYLKAHDYVEVDMKVAAAISLCSLDDPSMPDDSEGPFIVSWRTFQDYATEAKLAYPGVQGSHGMLAEPLALERAIESIRHLLLKAITQAHQTIVHRIDTRWSPVKDLEGTVRLRIVDIYKRRSPESHTPIASSTAGDSSQSNYRGRRASAMGASAPRTSDKRPRSADRDVLPHSPAPNLRNGETALSDVPLTDSALGSSGDIVVEYVESDHTNVPLISPLSSNARVLAHILDEKILRGHLHSSC